MLNQYIVSCKNKQTSTGDPINDFGQAQTSCDGVKHVCDYITSVCIPLQDKINKW